MTGSTVGAGVERPTALDVIPSETARTVMDEAVAALSALEHELAIARAEADAAAATIGTDVDDDLVETGARLRQMAAQYRADAEAYAARVCDAARSQAGALLEAARQRHRADGSRPTTATFGEAATATRLSLARNDDPPAGWSPSSS